MIYHNTTQTQVYQTSFKQSDGTVNLGKTWKKRNDIENSSYENSYFYIQISRTLANPCCQFWHCEAWRLSAHMTSLLSRATLGIFLPAKRTSHQKHCPSTVWWDSFNYANQNKYEKCDFLLCFVFMCLFTQIKSKYIAKIYFVQIIIICVVYRKKCMIFPQTS